MNTENIRKVRDAMRSLARELPSDSGARDAGEACFQRLEALDALLVRFVKAEDAAATAGLRADAAAQVKLALERLDAALAPLPADTLQAARAALA